MIPIHTLKPSTLRDGAVITENNIVGEYESGLPDCVMDAVHDIGKAVAGEYRLTLHRCNIERSVDPDGVVRITVRPWSLGS